MISTVLFDLDGTLINSWNLYIEAYRLTVQPYVRKPLTEEDIHRIKPSSELKFIEMVIPEKERDHAFKRFITHYSNLYDEMIGNIYDGVHQMLEKLWDQKQKVGIVTGKSLEAWNITKKKSNFGKFDVVITGNDVNNYKPYPEGITKAINQLGVEKNEVLYVGDSIVDQQTAQAAGVHHAASLWSKSKDEIEEFKQQIKENGTDLFLEKPMDVFEIPDLKQ
jgi:phosphoglycolate phosphatase/pyrophosphatase PpaX